MEKTPPELLNKIFTLFDPPDVKNLRQVCQLWNEVVEEATGLSAKMDDTIRDNRSFVANVKLNRLIIQNMSSHPFCLKYPNALKMLTCVKPVNQYWLVQEALNLQNLSTLRLFGEFFFLQDLPQQFSPFAFSNTYLPNLKTLSIEIPPTFRPVKPSMACGVFPSVEAKIAERSTKNIWFILQVIRSPKLQFMEIVDDYPRCTTSTIQRYQWWGQVLAGFMHYHQYSLLHLKFKKSFIPNPDDPFTTENIGIPLKLQNLCLHLLGTDLGNFHYWRSVIQAQDQLQTLQLHLNESFWKRFPITPFIKSSQNTLKELDLALEFDSNPFNIEAGSTFDFASIASCRELQSLKIGPWGYLAPTLNFHLIPRLLTNLTCLYLTFVDISTEELESIKAFENLKILVLQCLVQVNNGCVLSSVNLKCLKTFLSMRTLDSFAVDLVAVGASRNPVVNMAMQLFGKAFKGTGFFIPFELEDLIIISGSHLSAPPVHSEPEPIEFENAPDEAGNILPSIQGDMAGFENEIITLNPRGATHHGDVPDQPSVSEPDYLAFPFKCPCETKTRVLRRPEVCVSRFCVPSMVDLCEDLMRVDRLPLWNLYMDGIIPYCCIQEFLPNSVIPVNEDECCCVPFAEPDQHADKDYAEEIGVTITDEERLLLGGKTKYLDSDVINNNTNTVDSKRICYRYRRQVSSFQNSPEEDNKMAAAVLMGSPQSEQLPTVNSKDWFTQTNVTKQDSTVDVMTQYENQRFLWEEMDKLRIHSCDSESQTDLRYSVSNCFPKDTSTQKESVLADNSTQHEVTVTDSSTQNHITEDGQTLAIKSVSLETQNEIDASDKQTQVELKVMDVDTQIELKNVDSETQFELKIMDTSETQIELAVMDAVTQIESKTIDAEVQHECQGKGVDILRNELRSNDVETQIELSCSDSGTQIELSCTDSETQIELSCTDSETQIEFKGVNAASQIDIVNCDAETQIGQRGVDVETKMELIHVEEKGTETHNVSTVSENQMDAFVQSAVEYLDQCISAGNTEPILEQAVQTSNEVMPSVCIEQQTELMCNDANIQSKIVVSSMRTQTLQSKTCDQNIQTVFSPYSRQLACELATHPEKMEITTQTELQFGRDFATIELATIFKPDEQSSVQRGQFTDSSTQNNCTYPEMRDMMTSTEVDGCSFVIKVQVADQNTQYEISGHHQDSTTQSDIRYTDSTTITDCEVTPDRVVDSTTQYDSKLCDNFTQYTDDCENIDCTTQYDLIDFSDSVAEANGVDSMTFEGLDVSIPATTIRENLIKEELSSSKVSYLRERVEDCLQNWSWYQTEKKDEKCLEGLTIEAVGDAGNDVCTNSVNKLEEQNDTSMQENDSEIEEKIPVDVDTHSSGDTAVKGKRSGKKPAGVRKFCVIA